jgi:BASS family bile acid:Na+ symporter
VFNYFVPQASLWGKSYTGYFLGIVLFGMGLTLTLDDFKRILTQPLMVIVGTVAHFVIMPLVAVLLCWIFRLDGALAVGVILVGCCPSGTSSNVMSYLSRGDVALDVSIGILSTLCAPFMIPLLMQWLASQYVSVPVESLFLNAVKVVLFPIALGVICHAIFGEKIEKITVALPIVSQVAILLIIGVVVAANGPKLFVTSSLLAIPVVILHNLCGYALGFGFSKLMYKVYPKGFRYAQQKAITFEVGMQDSALGATLALTSLPIRWPRCRPRSSASGTTFLAPCCPAGGVSMMTDIRFILIPTMERRARLRRPAKTPSKQLTADIRQ